MGYVTTFATRRKLKVYGYQIKRELKGLTDEQLLETGEVVQIVSGYVLDEMKGRESLAKSPK